MYYPSKEYSYSPKAKEFWAAQNEADEYAKKIANVRNYTCNKVYGWNWNITISID